MYDVDVAGIHPFSKPFNQQGKRNKWINCLGSIAWLASFFVAHSIPVRKTAIVLEAAFDTVPMPVYPLSDHPT